MGKLLAGMLSALLIGLVLVPGARSAEIPPTEECVATYKDLSDQYRTLIQEANGQKQSNKLTREFARQLYAADCISAVEPLIKPAPARPFTKQCVEGAKAADRYWKPYRERLNTILTASFRRQKPKIVRIKKLDRRIRKLIIRGAPTSEIRALRTKRRAILKKSTHLAFVTARQATRLLEPQAATGELILTELVARRCLDPNSDLDDAADLPSRVLKRNLMVILYGLFPATPQRQNSSSGGKASVSSALPDLRALSSPSRGLSLPLFGNR